MGREHYGFSVSIGSNHFGRLTRTNSLVHITKQIAGPVRISERWRDLFWATHSAALSSQAVNEPGVAGFHSRRIRMPFYATHIVVLICMMVHL